MLVFLLEVNSFSVTVRYSPSKSILLSFKELWPELKYYSYSDGICNFCLGFEMKLSLLSEEHENFYPANDKTWNLMTKIKHRKNCYDKDKNCAIKNNNFCIC